MDDEWYDSIHLLNVDKKNLIIVHFSIIEYIYTDIESRWFFMIMEDIISKSIRMYLIVSSSGVIFKVSE